MHTIQLAIVCLGAGVAIAGAAAGAGIGMGMGVLGACQGVARNPEA